MPLTQMLAKALSSLAKKQMNNQLYPAKNMADLQAFQRRLSKLHDLRGAPMPTKNVMSLSRQIADICNKQIQQKYDENNKIKVLPFPTGSGKTSATIAYLAELSIQNRTSPERATKSLFVTREIKQAEEVAKAINQLADTVVAFALHSESKTKPNFEQLRSFDVLIVTHQGYINAIESHVATNGYSCKAWLYEFDDLIIIDEAPKELLRQEVIELEQFTKDLELLKVLTPPELHEDISLLESFCGRAAALLNGQSADRDFPAGFYNIDVRRLNSAIRDNMNNYSFISENDKNLGRIFGFLDMATKGWCMPFNHAGKHKLAAASHLLPKDIEKPIVLDATAEVSAFWNNLSDEVEFIKPEIALRRYQNFRLNIRREGQTGKSTNLPEARLSEIANQVSACTGQSLTVTHKDHIQSLKQCLKTQKGCAIANWFGLDGKNDWHDCSAVFVPSLPYQPRHHYAMIELTSSDQAPSGFVAGYQPTIDTQAGEVAALIIQAINRIRCRKVIDEVGNCEESEAFICIPKGDLGDKIIKLLSAALPGVQIAGWKCAHKNLLHVGRAKYAKAFIEELLANPGKLRTTSEVANAIGLTDAARNELHRNLRDTNSAICKALELVGVSLDIIGSGRGRKYLLKTPGSYEFEEYTIVS